MLSQQPLGITWPANKVKNMKSVLQSLSRQTDAPVDGMG